MDEYQRLAYLEAMGVQSYVPRYILPGAKPSVACQLPVVVRARQNADAAAVAASSAAEVVVNSPRGRARTADIQSLLEDAPAKPRVSTSKPEVIQPASGGNAAVRFTLRFVSTETGLLVVDATNDSVSEQRVLRFIRNLAFALTGQMPPRLQASPFRWPFADSPGLDRSEEAAREALLAAVQGNIERAAARCVLVLGEQAAHYLPPGVDTGSATLLQAPDCGVLFTDPLRKAELWQMLRAAISI